MIEVINRGAFCIVQVMSGRSTSNSLLDNPEGLAYGRRRSDGAPATAEQVFDEAITRELARIPLVPRKVKNLVLKKTGLPLPAIRRLAEESRRDWVESYRKLLARDHRAQGPVLVLGAQPRLPAALPPAGPAPRLVPAAHRRGDARAGEAPRRYLCRVRLLPRQPAAARQPLHRRARRRLARGRQEARRRTARAPRSTRAPGARTNTTPRPRCSRTPPAPSHARAATFCSARSASDLLSWREAPMFRARTRREQGGPIGADPGGIPEGAAAGQAGRGLPRDQARAKVSSMYIVCR